MINSHASQTNNNIIEKYCFNNDPLNCAIYGGLYQWDEMMNYSMVQGAQGICPGGFHIPTDGDWNTLALNLSGDTIAGGKMKETGLAHWIAPNAGASNSSGFTALGTGFRADTGNFLSLNIITSFWSSVLDQNFPWIYSLEFDIAGLTQGYFLKEVGYSVRCLKN